MKKLILLNTALLALGACSPTDYSRFVLGLGNPSNVPAGQYAEKILQYYDIDKDALDDKGVIAYGNNVGEVTTLIKLGEVGAGIIYRSDATTYELKIVGRATEEMCGKVLYPAATIKNNSSELVKNASKSFLEYLTNQDAMEEFNKVGFVSACRAKEISTQTSENVEISIFAATSLTASLNKIVEKYHTAYPNVNFVMNYAASGTLQNQIETNVEACNIFISAAQKQMNALMLEGLIESSTRFDILENEVCLCVPNSNPYNINSFENLKNILNSILGN